MKEYYYYYRDYRNRPLITVCLLQHGNKVARGVAVVGMSEDKLSDNPCKKIGRAWAKERASKALYRKDTPVIKDCFYHPNVMGTFYRIFGTNGNSAYSP